ncbi:MAG: hypothetical protein AB7O37_22760 [Vicinamibacteria bacterium]
MTRQVKGLLFLHYVRMLKSRKHTDWGRQLLPADMRFLSQRIEPTASYPMDVFERLGLAILDEIARGELGAVGEWGRQSADLLVESVPGLLVPGDPRESLMRFQAMRGAFFDFDALRLAEVTDRTARLEMRFEMGDRAEQAACVQARGFFQRLVELAGGREVRAAFEARAWEGDARTVTALAWT